MEPYYIGIELGVYRHAIVANGPDLPIVLREAVGKHNNSDGYHDIEIIRLLPFESEFQIALVRRPKVKGKHGYHNAETGTEIVILPEGYNPIIDNVEIVTSIELCKREEQALEDI